MSSAGPLSVDYLGEIHTVGEDERLSFGRRADLVVDENPYMHRVVGRFEARDGRWWISNLGSKIIIEIYDRTTQSRATLMPHTDQALPGDDTVARFGAGPTVYELDVRCDPIAIPAITEQLASDTITAADIPMTESQKQLVVALAEHKLREPQSPVRIPPSKEAAVRLGWPITKFNRKLDNVCDKLTKSGVTGLKAKRGGELATDRRRRLVEYAVASGLISADDLQLLDQSDLP